MTPRQKRIIGVLALANGVFLLAVATALRHSPSRLPAATPTSISTLSREAQRSATPPQPNTRPGTDHIRSGTASPSFLVSPTRNRLELCRWEATQRLAEAQLAGTADILPNGTVQFSITYPLTKTQTVTDAAQSAWNAFDIALALQNDTDCAPFNRVSVNINAYTPVEKTLLTAEVAMQAILDLADGTMDEGTFINHVTYAIGAPETARPTVAR